MNQLELLYSMMRNGSNVFLSYLLSVVFIFSFLNPWGKLPFPKIQAHQQLQGVGWRAWLLVCTSVAEVLPVRVLSVVEVGIRGQPGGAQVHSSNDFLSCTHFENLATTPSISGIKFSFSWISTGLRFAYNW